jgi:tRNA threonylcarbamoyl adenosine modification protein YeaZ
MKILALEFSFAQRSVAVLDASSEAPRLLSEVIETGAFTTRALGMVEDALRQSQLEREQIECIAIGLGPGSYTGIRAAIAVAQGWQLARAVNLLGISTAECLAAQAQEEGLRGRTSVVIDAQRNEFYLAGYELEEGTYCQVEPLRLASKIHVQERLDKGDLLIGPEVTNWFPSGRAVFPRAATVARLALGRTDFVRGEAIQPIYLRETQFVKAPPPRPAPGVMPGGPSAPSAK